MAKYFLVPWSFLFLDDLDKKNNYETIVWNMDEDKVFKVDRFGYFVLKTINDSPGIDFLELVKLFTPAQAEPLGNESQKIRQLLDFFIKENVVLEKE